MISPAPTFLALDFETANPFNDSACAIGLIRVERGSIVRREHYFIRPPSSRFDFTWVHGITWEQVKDSPSFGDLWPRIQGLFEGVDFVAAHNVGFDRRILRGCSARYGISLPEYNYLCTVQLARKTWQIFPTKLPDVCRHLRIDLKHHEALSDAEACARIVLASTRQGLTKCVGPDNPPDLTVHSHGLK